MARSKCSNQRPDTLMQDRSPPARRNHLQRAAGPYIRVNRATLTVRPLLQVFPYEQTSATSVGMSQKCHPDSRIAATIVLFAYLAGNRDYVGWDSPRAFASGEPTAAERSAVSPRAPPRRPTGKSFIIGAYKAIRVDGCGVADFRPSF
jgi:hypothetical protein